MATQNDNPTKPITNGPAETDNKAPSEAIIAALCARMSAHEAVLMARDISQFNLEVAYRALSANRGGRLVMKIPTTKGKPVEFHYEGFAALN